MTDLKARLLALLAGEEDEKLLPAVDSVSALKAAEELPIYEATAAQINYWHAFGNNVFLQTLLREYDLDDSSLNLHRYNRYKIGFDEKTHTATFAIDDTHYYAIDFNQWNSAPLDRTQACRVFEKICAATWHEGSNS